MRAVVLRDLRAAYLCHAPGFVVPDAVDDALERQDAWLDISLLLALHDAAGSSATVFEVCRRSVDTSSNNPVFAAMQRQMLKLLGRRPHAALRWFPGGYGIAMRALGSATFTGDEHGGRIDIVDAPAFIVAHEGFRSGLGGTLIGLLERMGWSCEITSRGGGLSFPMRWWRDEETRLIG